MNMGDALRRNARKYPAKLAVADERRRLSYAELDQRVNRLANALLGLGLTKGQNVAVLMGNRTEHVEALFALARAGLVGVPMDPRWRGREIAGAFRFFDIAAAILEHGVGPALLDALPQVPEFRGPIIRVGAGEPQAAIASGYEYEALLAAASASEPGVEVDSSDLFLIMITSGTTGFPKGCLATHEQYVLACLNHGTGGRGSGPDDIELLVSPLCFNSGRSSCLGHLFWGATVLLQDRFDPVEVMETVQRERVTYLALAPVMADRLLELPNLEAYDAGSLRYVRKVGSPLQRRTVEGLIRRLTPHVYQGYASTDAGSVSMLTEEEQLTRHGSAGKLIWAAEVKIVADDGRELAPGQMGEIWVRGPLVCAGYYKNPEANAASFRDGWLLTGDLGYLDEQGYLYIAGRKKHMIKSGSLSLFPDEIQEVLHTHPSVREAAVVGVPHPVWGEAVLGVVALLPGASATEQELIDYCRAELAAYKAPKAIRFVDELPHTELGKIATEALRARFAHTFQPAEAAELATSPPRREPAP